MKNIVFLYLLPFVGSFFLLSVGSSSWAQQQDPTSGDHLPQISATAGRVLPNGISQDDEIFSMWTFRYSHPSGGMGFYDFGIEGAHSAGVTWRNINAGLSLHIPIETLTAHVGLGVGLTRLSTESAPASTVGGAHFLGGVMSRIGGNVLARFDMKLNSQPGTSLFFGMGLVIELNGSSANDNAQ